MSPRIPDKVVQPYVEALMEALVAYAGTLPQPVEDFVIHNVSAFAAQAFARKGLPLRGQDFLGMHVLPNLPEDGPVVRLGKSRTFRLLRTPLA